MTSVIQMPSRDDASAHVAEEVRAWMSRRRLSQQAVANRLGTTQAAVSRRLTGGVPFDAQELVIIAEMVGVHPGAFFPGYDEGPHAGGGLVLSESEQKFVLALRSSLPHLDSNQEPTG